MLIFFTVACADTNSDKSVFHDNRVADADNDKVKNDIWNNKIMVITYWDIDMMWQW